MGKRTFSAYRRVFKTRVWASIDMVDGSDCWLWTGTLMHGKPVARFAYPPVTKIVFVQRYLYPHPIPVGRYVKQKCGNPICCNPDHQSLSTPM